MIFTVFLLDQCWWISGYEPPFTVSHSIVWSHDHLNADLTRKMSFRYFQDHTDSSLSKMEKIRFFYKLSPCLWSVQGGPVQGGPVLGRPVLGRPVQGRPCLDLNVGFSLSSFYLWTDVRS